MYQNMELSIKKIIIIRDFNMDKLKVFLTVFICFIMSQLIADTHFEKGYRYEQDGWIFVHIEGDPFERGIQHGFLLAKEYENTFNCYKEMTYETLGVKYSYFAKEAIKLHKDKIPEELLEEMKGIAEGLKKAGVDATLDDIIAWNAWIEITECYWPLQKDKYYSNILNKRKEKCSAFIATGDATKNKEIVLSHSTFDVYWNTQWANVIIDIVPTAGNRLIMQITPGYIASMTDYFINAKGVIGVETTIAGFNPYDESKTPEYVRSRLAMQYSHDIDSFISIINENNNGGSASTWLIGDTKTNEIACFEQGLLYQNIKKKKDGFFYGCNVVEDPRIRNLECSNTGYNDIRRHTGGRRVRFMHLLAKYYGKIDEIIAKKIMSDHYNVYEKKDKPSANTICAHYDSDPRYFMSSTSASHKDPYTPAGAVDTKITTTTLAKDLKTIARFGRPCGMAFDAKSFLKEHPQWKWQEKYLQSRKKENWTLLFPEK